MNGQRHLGAAPWGAFVVAVLVLVGSWGCAPPQMPKELEELDRILSETGANEVKKYPGATKYYRDSRELREAALRQYEDRNLAKARHYAIRGKIAYRTAQAVGQQVVANRRLEEANSKIESINPKVRELKNRRNRLQSRLADLREELNQLRTRRAAQRRSGSEGRQEATEEKARANARKALQKAADARERALEMRADQFAKALFNRANNQLKSAQALFRSNPEAASDVASTARDSASTFERAIEEARPKYEDFRAKQNPDERIDELRSKLATAFGSEKVESVTRGVRVVLAGLYGEGSSELDAEARRRVIQVANLAQTFSEFEILVSGFTRRGNPTENLTVSQLRARAVRDLFLEQGIADDRIETDGRGQNRIRYPDQPAQNDRVEVTFRMPATGE